MNPSDRIAFYLGLVDHGGLLVWAVANASRAAPLASHLGAVLTADPATLRSAPRGAAVVYVAAPEHAATLQAIRPVIADRALRVVMVADDVAAGALRLAAPDWWDWISHRVEMECGS